MKLALDCIVLRLGCKKRGKKCSCIAMWLIIGVILIKVVTIIIGLVILLFNESVISYKLGLFIWIDVLVIMLSLLFLFSDEFDQNNHIKFN